MSKIEKQLKIAERSNTVSTICGLILSFPVKRRELFQNKTSFLNIFRICYPGSIQFTDVFNHDSVKSVIK